MLAAVLFCGEIPLRAAASSNVATRTIMHALMGRKMRDTQTGLRGLPPAFACSPHGCRRELEANGYEFELEMLLSAHRWGVPLVEESIHAIYYSRVTCRRFTSILSWTTMKIYFILLRLDQWSASTALLDNVVFIVALHQGASLLLAQALGRIVGLAFNYTMVRSSVFYSHQKHRRASSAKSICCWRWAAATACIGA